jgi:hypothetical protein
MRTAMIMADFQALPADLQEKAAQYISLLKQEVDKQHVQHPQKRIFGLTKGKYKMAPDFDEPLDDFKDCM